MNRRHLLAASMLPLLRPGAADARQFAKRELWNNATGPHLRGAVLTQRRVYPEIDGPEFLGPGPIGAPITDEALAALAAAGANLLILSHPGIFTETPPFRLAEDSLANLDDLVQRAARWGLYVVIGYRSGPGRSAFTFHRDDAGSWFPAHMIDDRVWTDFSYHQAWEDMWRTTARQFRARANVAGYLLMVEPNANQVGVDAVGRPLEIWQADRLAEAVENTPADWAMLARRLSAAVRSVDPETPLLVSPDGYASPVFERNLGLAPDAHEVLCVHDYAPRDYTHQAADAGRTYAPGEARFQPPEHRRWMMGEFGLHRWAPAAPDYLDDRISDLERAGAGWAVFRWDSGWAVYERQENRFNVRAGGPNSQILRVLRRHWRSNQLRPQLDLRR